MNNSKFSRDIRLDSDEHILYMQANRDFLTELVNTTLTPDISASTRQHAQHLLNRYADIFDSAQSFSSRSPRDEEPNSKTRGVTGKNKNVLSWVSWCLSDAKRATDEVFYAGMLASALGFAAVAYYYVRS